MGEVTRTKQSRPRRWGEREGMAGRVRANPRGVHVPAGEAVGWVIDLSIWGEGGFLPGLSGLINRFHIGSGCLVWGH